MSTRPLQAEWFLETGHELELRVAADDESYYSGYVSYDFGRQLKLSTSSFQVAEHLRGQGLGTRIMMGTLALAKANGIIYSSAHVETPASLRIRQKIFGEAMAISDIYWDSPELPITVDEAIQSLQLGEELKRVNPDIDDTVELGLNARALLTNLDTTGWELPIELNQMPLSSLHYQ